MERDIINILPDEIHKGETDRVINQSLDRLGQAFETRSSKEEAVNEVVSWFEAIMEA